MSAMSQFWEDQVEEIMGYMWWDNRDWLHVSPERQRPKIDPVEMADKFMSNPKNFE